MLDILQDLIAGNQSSQFFLQYGLPTITLSSNAIRATDHDTDGKVQVEILNDDFELLIGSK